MPRVGEVERVLHRLHVVGERRGEGLLLVGLQERRRRPGEGGGGLEADGAERVREERREPGHALRRVRDRGLRDGRPPDQRLLVEEGAPEGGGDVGAPRSGRGATRAVALTSVGESGSPTRRRRSAFAAGSRRGPPAPPRGPSRSAACAPCRTTCRRRRRPTRAACPRGSPTGCTRWARRGPSSGRAAGRGCCGRPACGRP